MCSESCHCYLQMPHFGYRLICKLFSKPTETTIWCSTTQSVLLSFSCENDHFVHFISSFFVRLPSFTLRNRSFLQNIKYSSCINIIIRCQIRRSQILESHKMCSFECWVCCVCFLPYICIPFRSIGIQASFHTIKYHSFFF